MGCYLVILFEFVNILDSINNCCDVNLVILLEFVNILDSINNCCDVI